MSEKKGNQRYKTLLGVFLKTNKRRLITSVIVSVILFTILTTFLLTWFNYRYKSFQNYESSYDWYDDNEISITYQIFDLKNNPNLFLDLATSEIHSVLDTLATNMFDNYTALMYYEMESLNYLSNQTYDMSLLTLQHEAYEVLTNSLIAGRLPTNESELLYYPNDLTTQIYELGDNIGLQITSDETTYIRNFTIVGIINHFSYNLYQNGFSNDVFQYYQINQELEQYDIDLFFTNSHDFIDIILNYPFDRLGRLLVHVDFNYQFNFNALRNLLTITDELNSLRLNQDFEYFPKASIFCYDLEYFIISFQVNWIFQTLSIFILGVPIFLLLGLLIVEMFNVGVFEKTNQFKLFKTYGLEFGTLRKILFTENLVTVSTGLLLGVPLGILIGFVISSLGLNRTNYISYFNALLEPLVYVSILTLFLVLIIGSYITGIAIAKRTVYLTSEVYKTKRNKVIRKLLTSTESLLLISGIILFVIGFLAWQFIPDTSYIIIAVLHLLTVFVFFIVIGILFILASLFLIFSRLVISLWRFIGLKAWQKRKSYFTLALKQLATYSRDYKRVVFAMLLVSLCVSPGLVLLKSSNDHLIMESNLKVGFSDICIRSFANNNTIIMENLSAIIGVDLITKVELVEISELSNIKATNFDDRVFDVNILNIYNISEFIEIISPNFPSSCEYTLTDISELETNMTYLMSSKYAHKNNYDKNNIYSSSSITSPLSTPYNMIYINRFDYFPLLPYQSSNFLDRLTKDQYNLVMSNLTYSQLKHKFAETTRVSYETYILVKINSTANKTSIVKMIEDLSYPIQVSTFDDELNALKLQQNKFTLVFTMIITIISFGLISLYGILTGMNIYKQKMRIIESEYNVGAQKHQIWLNFSIEVILATIIPTFISVMLSSILLYSVYDIFLGIPQIYKNFVPWLPVWFIILIILFCLVALMSGWLPGMWIQFQKYKPVRQE
ncbi:MAG: hypothetical protein ACFFDW_00705 [Candidatus Thorarchaeota archaeon]